MNTKLLKQKILDLAIRGKLTQQLKSDGTAADLLKELADAKSALSQPKGKKSKKFAPISRIYCENGVWFEQLENAKPKDISEEIPFEIPENWTWCRLECVCFDIADIDHKMPAVCDNGIPYISPLNFVANNKIDFAGAKKISKEDFLQLSKKCKPERGDIIFPRYGTIGVIRTVETDIDFLVSYSCATIKPCKNHMDARFVSALLQSPLIQEIEIPRYINKTTQANVGLQSIKKFLFALPPLAEQQRIVEKIQEAFAEIDSIEKNKELLKTHIKQARQKILDLAIHGKLVPQNKTDEPASVLLERITRDNPHYEKIGLDERRETKDERSFKDKRHSREGGNLLAISKDEIPFDVPENWAWCRLGNILAPMQSASPKGEFFKYIDIDAIDNSICRIKSPKIVESKKAPSRASRFTKKDDILFSLVRPYLRNIAKVTENDCIASTGFFVCSPIIVNSDFCFYLLTSNYVVDGLNQFMKGDNSPSISSQNLVDFTIPLPPLNEQSRIVAKIEELFTELDSILQNI